MRKNGAKFYSDMLGTRQEILFENEDKNGIIQGFSSNYIKFITDFNADLTGQIIPVILSKADNEFCTGEVLSHKNSIDLVTS